MGMVRLGLFAALAIAGRFSLRRGVGNSRLLDDGEKECAAGTPSHGTSSSGFVGEERYIGGVPVYNDKNVGQHDAASRGWLVVLHSNATGVWNPEPCAVLYRTTQDLGLDERVGCLHAPHTHAAAPQIVRLVTSEQILTRILREFCKNLASNLSTPDGCLFVEPNYPTLIVSRLFVEPNHPTLLVSHPVAPAVSNDIFSTASKKLTGLTGKGVHVYVADDGIRATHLEFGGRASADADATQELRVTCHDPDTVRTQRCAVDYTGHGTAHAALIAGKNRGVAPDARVHGVKIGGDTYTASVALVWISENAKSPSVTSVSLGAMNYESSVIMSAVYLIVAAGSTVVTGAGDSDMNACEDVVRALPFVITVGAKDARNGQLDYSNWGPCVDLWAPGVGVTSAGTDNDNATTVRSGSPVAAAYASGAAARLLERNPSSLPDNVRKALLANTVKLPQTNHWAYTSNRRLLNVGFISATSSESFCPSFAHSVSPNKNGDCRCQPDFNCVGGSGRACPFSGNGEIKTSDEYFSSSCKDCNCVPGASEQAHRQRGLCPKFATSRTPNQFGQCACMTGTICRHNHQVGCPVAGRSMSAFVKTPSLDMFDGYCLRQQKVFIGGEAGDEIVKSARFFSPSCVDCECKVSGLFRGGFLFRGGVPL